MPNDKRKIKKMIVAEMACFAAKADKLPKRSDLSQCRSIGALYVVSGGGSYLHKTIASPSDQIYKNKKWYPGQDQVRLAFAKKWLLALNKIDPNLKLPLIYNGTKVQNEDLLLALKQGKFKLPGSLFICPGEIARTADQVRKFTFAPEFKKGSKLAIISHSAHLPRVLRLINRFPKPFKGVEILVLPVNVSDPKGQKQMERSELVNLMGAIDRGEATGESYPYKLIGDVEILPVCQEDLMDVFKLSNQRSVRSMSFNQGKIDLENHKRWFAKKLKDRNTVMLKAVIGGRLSGQVRLDIKAKDALIGISTSERFRGMGVASGLIMEAKNQAAKKGVLRIVALIKPDNVASASLFKKHGFKYEGKTVEGEIVAEKYIYKVKK